MTLRRSTRLILSLLPVLVTASVHAGAEYEKGWDYFKTGNYSVAKNIWRPLAEQGNGDAALGLAIIYESGPQTEQNLRQSIRWYELAADKGIPEALYNLGIKYFNGSGVSKNQRRSYELWKQAAEAGLGTAQTKLANLYLRGVGTKKDEAEALRWYRQAANQGNAESMYNLSVVYRLGHGVPKNTHQFRHWLRQAAERDYAPAQFELGLMMLHGESMEHGVADGKSWLAKAANNGLVDAQYYLGTLYMNGHILELDKDSAVELLTAAARQGHKDAKQALVDIQLRSGKPGRGDQHLAAFNKGRFHESPAKTGNTIAPDKPEALLETRAAATQAPPAPIQDQNRWLLQQEADNFTIRLIVSQDPAAIDHYLKQLPKDIEPFNYRFRHNNSDWVAVACGIYSDYEAALHAMSDLPGNIRETKPWIYNIGLLQEVIRQ